MRRHVFPAALLFMALTVSTALAQTATSSPSSQTRPRTISTQQQKGAPAVAAPTPGPAVTPAQLPAANPPSSLSPQGSVPPTSSTLPPSIVSQTPQSPATSLAVSKIRARIQEADRNFKTRPQQTSLSPASLSFVTLAALDPSTSQIHLITLPKDLFLSRGSEATVTTQLGATVNLRIIRANGVNTAVTIFENTTKRSFVPLLVEYP
ncbi:MAG TPA: hypothetical protein VGO69_08720, partial [Pyrinomonadaceae bacterium]|nr:hypothetical protein [Pyrinomonadaceae bacterium]